MRKIIIVLLAVIALVGIGVGISYPIRYKMQLDSNNSELEDLSSMRRRVMEEQGIDLDDVSRYSLREGEAAPEAEPAPEATEEASPEVTAQTGGEARDEGAAEPSRMPEATREASVTPQPGAAETQAPLEDEGNRTRTTDNAEEERTPPQASDAETDQPPVEAEDRQTPPQASDAETERPPVEAEDRQTPPPVGPGEVETDRTTLPPQAQVITPTPGIMDLIINDVITPTDTPRASSTPVPVTPSPSPTPDRSVHYAVDSYKSKTKVQLDESMILPELREIYALNHDLVGWLYIEDTNIDYPVVQSEDRTFYLSHDFYGNSNANGQIIMEDKCDPYTPSYNLVLSGHHMNSGAMFGQLGKYKDKSYWETHKIVELDTLMARKQYVIFAAFYSADYDEHEEGFRYSADIQYEMDADLWLGEIQANKIYDTGIDTEFGDEFVTLTTCDHSRRRDGRFVLVARRIREGEKIL